MKWSDIFVCFWFYLTSNNFLVNKIFWMELAESAVTSVGFDGGQSLRSLPSPAPRITRR